MNDVKLRKIDIPKKYEDLAQQAIGNALGRIVAGDCPDFMKAYIASLEADKTPKIAKDCKDLAPDIEFITPEVLKMFLDVVGGEIASFVGPEGSTTHGGMYHLTPIEATMVAAWAAAILGQTVSPKMFVQDKVTGYGEGESLVRTEAAMVMTELEQQCDSLPTELGPENDGLTDQPPTSAPTEEADPCNALLKDLGPNV